MRIKIIYIFFCLSVIPVLGLSQSKYFTREGHVHFKSDAKVELIESNNFKVASIVDFETGNIEVSVLMKAFEFKKALMEEHFNENYLETNDFPKSIFKGKIKNIESIALDKNGEHSLDADGEYGIEIEGELMLHGVTKSIIVPATLKFEKGILTGNCSFIIKVEDYNIKIPTVVKDNIAKEIVITINLNYKSFER